MDLLRVWFYSSIPAPPSGPDTDDLPLFSQSRSASGCPGMIEASLTEAVVAAPLGVPLSVSPSGVANKIYLVICAEHLLCVRHDAIQRFLYFYAIL